MKSVSPVKLPLLFLLLALLYSSCSTTSLEKHSVHNGLYNNCSLCNHSIETKNLNSIEYVNANYELEASTNNDVVQIIIPEYKSVFTSVGNNNIIRSDAQNEKKLTSKFSKIDQRNLSNKLNVKSTHDEKPVKETRSTGLGLAILALFLGLTTPFLGFALLVTAPAGLILSIIAWRRSRKRSFARFIAILATLINAFVTFLLLMFMFAF